MEKQELIELLKTLTREDWKLIDSIKDSKLALTEEELIQQELFIEQQNKEIIENKINSLGFVLPEIITKEFFIEVLEKLNVKEFIGDYSEFIDEQVKVFGDINNAFYSLIKNYLN